MIGPRVGAKIGPRTGPGVGGSSSGPTATLSVAIADSLDPVITFVAFSFAVDVTNVGAVTANSVSVVVTLDASLAFVSGTGTGWSVNAVGQVVTCTRATLATGAAPTITVNVTSGGSALTASTGVSATASNANTALDTETTVVKLVTRDATSLIRCPSSLTEFQDFNAYHVALGTANFPNVLPSLGWLMQQASGNCADVVGTFTGAVTGTPISFQQAVAGWTRLAILGGDAGSGSIVNTDAGLPDPVTQSMWMVSYVVFTGTPAANRFVQVNGTATLTTSKITSTPRLQGVSGANTATGTVNPTGVRLVETLYDVGNNRSVIASDQEKLSPVRGLTIGKRYFLLPSFPGGYLYSIGFFDTAAQVSDAGRKAYYQALGWTIPWS